MKTWIQSDLQDLGIYRIKSHCSYDTTKPSSYSVFQIEITNTDLQKWYKGKYILEVWNQEGQRLFQTVLTDQCHTWKLCNDVLVFRQEQAINVLWLKENKFAKYRHPVQDMKEIDLIYFKDYLVVALEQSFKFIQLNPNDVKETLADELNFMVEKDFSGLVIQEGRVGAMIYNPLTDELVFVIQAKDNSILFKRLILQQQGNRQVSLDNIIMPQIPAKQSIKRVDKRQGKGPHILDQVIQITSYIKKSTLHIIVLRANEVIESFQNYTPIYIGPIANVERILPHADKIIFQLKDRTLQSALVDNAAFDRVAMTDQVYYKYQALEASEIKVNFYTDMVVVNQSVFLLRDNIVFIYDTFEHRLDQFPTKQKILSLYKLRLQQEDANQFPETKYKVVCVHKNGSLATFFPKDEVLMKDWERQENQGTPMCQQKETIVSAIVNQNSLSNIYIVTQTSQNDYKLYQLMANTAIIDLNLKLQKTDQIFLVNSTSRMRELIAICDAKNLTIFKNEKGQLAKIYQFSIATAQIKQFLPNAVIYFQREYLLIINKRSILMINTRTNTVDKLKLNGHVISCSNFYIDAKYFYLITDSSHAAANGGGKHHHLHNNLANQQNQLAIITNDMIESFFSNPENKPGEDIVSQAVQSKKQMSYPTWSFNKIVKMDFDYYNASATILTGNLEVITFPLIHRNTVSFNGMAERTFYLTFRKIEDKFYALDKQNFMNCWNRETGHQLSRIPQEGIDYRAYDVDRKVYDKGWFNYSLIFKSTDVQAGSMIQQAFKIISIDDGGKLVEHRNFFHPHAKNMQLNLYFNKSFTKAVELLININKKSKAAYNIYSLDKESEVLKLIRVFDPQVEWHHKTLYPYNLDQTTLDVIDQGKISKYDLYKVIGPNLVKVFNAKDGMEINYNIDTGLAESYIALQYSFQNTKDSFYDKKTGQFFIQEIEIRLQNFYEQLRRKILLKNCSKPSTVSVDVSAKSFKHKYVIEQSYTAFDLKFYEQFVKGNEKQLLVLMKDLSAEHIKRLVHNIFPDKNQTILHLIPNCFEVVDRLTALGRKEGFVLPFLINADGDTPLDQAIKNNDLKQANSIMKLLAKAPLDHHSRFISNIVPKLIELNLPYLQKYFDKRTFQIGQCAALQSGNLKIDSEQDFTASPTTFQNDDINAIKSSIMNNMYKEQAISLEVLDLPLHPWKELPKGNTDKNQYEMLVMKSLSNSKNQEIFNQKSVRSMIDYLWPRTKTEIKRNILYPYLAFILYYMLYLIVLKNLNAKQIQNPDFFKLTSGMFTLFDLLFKILLFCGCAYFFQHDYFQIKATSNPIVIWSYMNAIPLFLMLFIISYDVIVKNSPHLEKTFYSASAFLIWIRIIHLFKLFGPTAHLLRMGTQILVQMRFLIYFILVSLVSFGFTFYFLSGKEFENPLQGMSYMFLVLIGNYDSSIFDDNYYLQTLLILVSFINSFFIFTLLVGIAIFSFQTELDAQGVLAYREKASLIGLYAYLLSEEPVRDQHKRYLLIATIMDNKRKVQSGGAQGAAEIHSTELGKIRTKLVKSFDRRLTLMSSKFDKTFKDIQERLDNLTEGKEKLSLSPAKKQMK